MKEVKNYIYWYDNNFIQKYSNEDLLKVLRTTTLYKNNLRINIKEIIEKMGINLNFNSMEMSGEYDENKNEISINILEPEYRQRFTMAHELGHKILNHPGINYRNTLLDVAPLADRGYEISANKFAADILLPIKLVRKILEVSIYEMGLNGKSLSDDDIDLLIKSGARKADVSESCFSIRIDDLNLIVNGDNN